MEQKTTVDLGSYISRTDNKYFPNTKKEWEEFMWKLHFMGGRAFIVAMHLDRLEKQARKNEKDSQSN